MVGACETCAKRMIHAGMFAVLEETDAESMVPLVRTYCPSTTPLMASV